MRRSRSQLRAIAYSYQRKQREEADKLLELCKVKGLKVKSYKYSALQIKECQKALLEV